MSIDPGDAAAGAGALGGLAAIVFAAWRGWTTIRRQDKAEETASDVLADLLEEQRKVIDGMRAELHRQDERCQQMLRAHEARIADQAQRITEQADRIGRLEALVKDLTTRRVG